MVTVPALRTLVWLVAAPRLLRTLPVGAIDVPSAAEPVTQPPWERIYAAAARNCRFRRSGSRSARSIQAPSDLRSRAIDTSTQPAGELSCRTTTAPSKPFSREKPVESRGEFFRNTPHFSRGILGRTSKSAGRFRTPRAFPKGRGLSRFDPTYELAYQPESVIVDG